MVHKSMQTTWTASRHARGSAGQPVRGVIGGAAFHLAQQALLAVQVEEAGMPAVRQHGVLPGLIIDGGPGPAAPVLIDPQMCCHGGRPVQQRIRRGGERLVHHRPGNPGVPGRLRRGDPPLSDLGTGQAAQPGGDPAPRRQRRHPLGKRLPQAPAVAALAPDLDPAQVHRIPGPPHVPRPGHHRLMHPVRDHAAIRAHPGRLPGRDRPYLNTAIRSSLHAGNLQALHPEQRRRRILEHDARGFLLIWSLSEDPRSQEPRLPHYGDTPVTHSSPEPAGTLVRRAQRHRPPLGRMKPGQAHRRPRTHVSIQVRTGVSPAGPSAWGRR